MKKIYLSVLAIGIALASQAQSLSPTVIASTGGFSSNGSGSLSYTVGEMTMVQTFTSGNNILTQGFQQPTSTEVSLLEMTNDEFGSVIVYPVPAVDNLRFGFQFPEAGNISVSVFNNIGQKVADVFHTNYLSGKEIQELNVSAYAAGLYFLTVNFTSKENGKTHTVSKKFQVIN